MNERPQGRTRPKKGAHYSRSQAFLLAIVLVPSPVLGAKQASRTESDARKAESELQAVKSEIDRISKEVSGEQVERDRLTRELRSAEISVGKARENRGGGRQGRAGRAARRAARAAGERE